MIYDVIIIGGGAAGLYAAAQLAKYNTGASRSDGSNKVLSVLVFEKTRRPGSKLLISGGGQCNITHGGSIKDFLNCYGENGKKLRKILYSHNNDDVREFLSSLGVEVFEREDGKVFPVSLSAEEVRKALFACASENGCVVKTETPVSKIVSNEDGTYFIYTDTASKFTARNVIVACGGRSFPGTGSDGSIFSVLEALGFEITPQAPALTPIYVNEYPYSALSGISFENAEIRLEGRKAMRGDLLFTHKELSGPLIINASRYIKPGDHIALSYIPAVNTQELSRKLKSKAQGSKKNLETFIAEICDSVGYNLPKRFVEAVVARTENELPSAKLLGSKASSASGKALDYIARLLTNDAFTVNSLGSYNIAMVTKGGVSLDEIDLTSMQTKKYDGLYIVGETLDVDGDTGGYNLQFAFSSAYSAVQGILSRC